MLPRIGLHAAALSTIVAAASYYSIGVIRWRALHAIGTPSFDIYEWAYPNMIYALRSLERGHGLWWSAYQNCGQPFFANIQNSLLYPPYALFLLLPMDAAYLALVTVNLTIGGLGAYLLCRHFGVDEPAALCGALTFELGGKALQLASWAPMTLGPYVWIPMALYACERVISRPSYRAGIVLGGVLALQLLAGFPQTSLLTYQIVALRVGWELATRRDRAAWRAVGAVLLGFVLAPCLVAVQLLPALDVVATSLRGEQLSEVEKNPAAVTWVQFRSYVDARGGGGAGNVFSAIASGLALVGFLVPARRRVAAFYLLVGALFLTLAFDNPLFRLYDQIPILNTFRDRGRALWMLAAPLGVLVAFGAASLTEVPAERRGVHPLAILLLLGGVAGFWSLSHSGLRIWEWFFVLAVCGAILVTQRSRWPASFVRVSLPVLVGASFLIVGRNPVLSNLENVSVFYEHAEVFEFVRERMTLQDRIDVLGQHMDFSLMPKIASVFEIPTVRDYEPLTSLRYAELMIMLVKTRTPMEATEKLMRLEAGESPMRTRNEYIFFTNQLPSNRPLLNLLAVRFLITDPAMGEPFEGAAAPLKLLAEIDGLRVYENDQALPRAYYVPGLVVEENPKLILSALARSPIRPRHVVLVENPPADGFQGNARGRDESPARGSVEIRSDRGEEIVMRSFADEDGFVFISDQHYPGWEATVNGIPTPIMRANYAFKALRVPAGSSDIVLRYRPKSVPLGAGLSLATMLVAGAIAFMPGSRGG